MIDLMKTAIMIGIIIGLIGCGDVSTNTNALTVDNVPVDAAADSFAAQLPKDAGCYYVDEYVFGGPDAGNHPSIVCP